MCTHSKDVKDAQLTAAVPACRKSLESFILVVKALLKKHNALSALTIGVLKHRNLQGDIIPSQRAEASDDSDRDDYRLVETKVPRKRKMAPTATGSSSSSKKTTKRKPKRGSSDVESMDEDAAEEREAEADRSEQRLSSTYIADSDDSDEDVSEEDAEDGEDDG